MPRLPSQCNDKSGTAQTPMSQRNPDKSAGGDTAKGKCPSTGYDPCRLRTPYLVLARKCGLAPKKLLLARGLLLRWLAIDTAYQKQTGPPAHGQKPHLPPSASPGEACRLPPMAELQRTLRQPCLRPLLPQPLTDHQVPSRSSPTPAPTQTNSTIRYMSVSFLLLVLAQGTSGRQNLPF